MRINLGAVVSGIRKRFYDNFSARANTIGGLGIATDGSLWNAVNRTIQVTAGAATATTTPTSGGAGDTYPVAAVTLPKSDNVIKVSNTNEGSAIALWVQSSSDWWMVNIEGTQVTNTNYAGTTYWSYNYAYQYTQNNPSNYVYTFTTYPIQIPSYSYQLTSGATNYSTGVTTFYAVFASGIPTTSAVPYTAQNIYYASSTPYTQASYTPYTGSTAYSASGTTSYTGQTPYTSTAGATTYTKGPTSYYKLSNTYFISSASYSSGTSPATYKAGATSYSVSTNYAAPYSAGPTNYSVGITSYGASWTAGATTYTSAKDITGYTSGSTTYTAGATTYTVLPPGYWSTIPYTSSIPYTSAWTSGAPYTPGTSYDWSFTPGTYYFVTTSGFTFATSATYYTYASGTTTTYNEYLKIKKSVANVVSEVTSTLVSNTQTAKSLLISILGNQITARAYSDTNFVTQIGSDLVYTATGATITTTYGIGVSPSAYNQSAIIGSSVEINRN